LPGGKNKRNLTPETVEKRLPQQKVKLLKSLKGGNINIATP